MNNTAFQIYRFISIIEKLCVVKRVILLSTGGDESDADHIFKLSFLALMVAPYLKQEINYAKLLELALVHDIVEAETGDIETSQHASNPEIKKQKKEREQQAIEHYKSILPYPLNKNIYDIYMEYEARQTKESKVLKFLDRLDARIQSCLYDNGDLIYWQKGSNVQWYYEDILRKQFSIKELEEDILDNLETVVIEAAKAAFIKSGIPLYNYQAPLKPIDKTAQQILDFYKVTEKLCSINRDNLLHNGEQESDSDHIFKLAFLVMMIAPYLKKPHNYTKLLEMALVHDIVEAETGDYSLSTQTPEIKTRKKQKEQEAIEHYKSVLPHPLNEKIYDLFNEYEARQTHEAKLIYALDKLEANLQMNANNAGDLNYVCELENGHWYFEYSTAKKELIKELDEEILSELENVIINVTKDNIKKCKASA